MTFPQAMAEAKSGKYVTRLTWLDTDEYNLSVGFDGDFYAKTEYGDDIPNGIGRGVLFCMEDYLATDWVVMGEVVLEV